MGDELIALGGAFLAAGLLARVGRRIGLPTIPFFIVAGILTGPFTPGLVLIESPEDLSLFAAVGLVLLLFHLGLEFSLNDLTSGGRSLTVAGGVFIILNVGGGFVFGLSLGWGFAEALVIAGAIGISSSAIVTKLLVELRRLANPETRIILGVIVVEDMFLALYLAILQPILGGSQDPLDAAMQFGRAFGFLVVLFAVARFAAGWVARFVSSNDDELLTVLFVGLAVFVAGMAEEIGVSDAIGALMVGLILGETALRSRIERLVLPLRDAFAAVFFFGFGLTIDPVQIRGVAGPVVVAVLLSILLNIFSGLIVAVREGYSRRAAANLGLTVVGRGEFSLILATLALAAGLDSRIGPFVAVYVLTLAILGPLMTSRSSVLAAWLPREWFGRRASRPVPATQPLGPQSDRVSELARRINVEADEGVTLSGRLIQGAASARRRWQLLRESPVGRLVLPLSVLLGVVVYALVGYLLAGYPFGDAFVLTWGDLTPANPAVNPGNLAPRFFPLTVSTLGSLALLAIILAALSIANEGGFGLSSRRRHMEEKLERLEDHYIICAYGRVGQATAREFEVEGVPFVIIDTKEELEARMRRDGVLYIIGDPTSEEVLRRARLDHARGIVCAVDSDATNVYVTLTARSMNPDIYIVARASGPDSPERLYRAGANRVISPYMASGRQMALLAIRPRVVDSIEVLGRRLEELEIEEGSPLIGLTVRQACDAAIPLLVHRADGTTVTNPGPEVLVQQGDRILAWGEAAQLRNVESST